MAREANFEAYIGTDHVLEFTVYDDDADPVVPKDVSGFAMTWILRKTDKISDPALLTKTTGAGITVVGTFDADPEVNTQRVRVAIADTDTYDTAVVITPRDDPYRHSLKRTDAGSEAILSIGDYTLLWATARA